MPEDKAIYEEDVLRFFYATAQNRHVVMNGQEPSHRGLSASEARLIWERVWRDFERGGFAQGLPKPEFR